MVEGHKWKVDVIRIADEPGGWRVVCQGAHALLAAQLVFPWRKRERCEPWCEILNAIAQHDNGWQEWETGHWRLPGGVPRNFTEMCDGDIVTQAQRGMTRAAAQSRWCGLLVARHVRELHRHRGVEPGPVRELLEEIETKVDAWATSLGVTKARIEEAYAFLRYGDYLSLLLCMNALDEGERTIDGGPHGTCYRVRSSTPEVVQIRPWPYEEEWSHEPVSGSPRR